MKYIADAAAPDWASEIRRLRRSKSLKQLALADALGVDQGTVSRWERGHSIPGLEVQRRLRDFLRRPIPDEFLLKHIVTVCPGTVVLSDQERVMQAVSRGYSLAHGIPQQEMPGRCNRGKFGPDLEVVVEEICRYGFYRGDLASATYVCRAPSLSGHRAPVPIKVVWTPVPLADQILLRGDRVEISDADCDRELARTRHGLRVVTMDELIG